MKENNIAVEIVSNFLDASMAPDPVRAASYMAADAKITFTGRREMADASEVIAFNKNRYQWVKKAIGDYDWMERDDCTVVYSTGYLYGQWPDGREFAGNRYVDRYEVKNGKIVKMDVWNDSAEWILEPSVNRTEK